MAALIPRLPDLSQSLQDRDLGHLGVIAELWGLEIEAPNVRTGLSRLVPLMLNVELITEVLDALPGRAQAALQELLRAEGCLPWAAFTRQYGALREMGVARRDRERPFENANATPTEALWYRGVIGRAFFDTKDGPEEFAFIPGDLLALLPAPEMEYYQPLGRLASPSERAYYLPAKDTILDDACTLLSGVRLGLPESELDPLIFCGDDSLYPLSYFPLQRLLSVAGLLDEAGLPNPEQTRAFLEVDRGEALLTLVKAWLDSVAFDELRCLPGLSAEGEWLNDPQRTRESILDFLCALPGFGDDSPERPYWSLSSFVAAVKAAYPDFQRPAGDYDSWYLRDITSGEYLRGFEHWDEVDGALIRFMIAGPLHWLGITELAVPAESGEGIPVTAFRFSAWGVDLLRREKPLGLRAEDGSLTVRADGRIRVPSKAPRVARYQVARFGEWDGYKDGFYRYRLTPTSLNRAREQGLHVHHLLGLLERYSTAVPPNLVKALERWEARGIEARLDSVTVLRVKDPALLKSLRTSRASRFLGDSLGPTAVIVRQGAWEKVLSALVEMGYLGEVTSD